MARATSSLPDAAFADDEHRRGGIGRMGDLLVHLQHRRGAPDEAPGGPAGISAGGSASRAALLERAIHDPLHLRDDEGLADVVECAGSNRFDGRLERAEPADQHDGRLCSALNRRNRSRPDCGRVQVDVRDQQVERPSANPAPLRQSGSLRPTRTARSGASSSSSRNVHVAASSSTRRMRGIALNLRQGQRPQSREFDDEQRPRRLVGARRRSRRCARMTSRTMASPSPVP